MSRASILHRAAASGLLLSALAGCREPVPQSPPRLLTTSSPFHYPQELWDAQVEGATTLRLYVGPQGAADTVRVEKTSGYAAFDSAAVDGVTQLRFEPARRGPDAVGAWVLLPVHFDLPRDSAAPPAP